MKLNIKAALSAVAITLVLAACNQQVVEDTNAADTVNLEEQASMLGYTIGAQMAGGLKAQGLEEAINIEALKLAIDDVLSGKEPQLNEEQMQAAMMAHQQAVMAELKAKADANLAAGEKFLEENGKADGVVTTESGLQYQVLREGKGAKPAESDTVKVHYLGKLIDGTQFDSSYDRGTPAEFPIGGVIPGFSEGLQAMNEGAKYRLVIPAGIAYGENAPPSIGANQVLIFEVELIEVLNKSTETKEG